MDIEERKRRHYAATEKWRLSNIEKCRADQRARYWNNREKFLAAGAKWRSENREKSRKAARRWQSNNVEKFKADHADWRRRNSDRRTAKQTLRKCSKLNATPAWAVKFFIREAYNLALRRTKIFGFSWHVDHVLPLQSKLVCGLHVHNNLQVIPAVHNISKHNRHWPDMP